MAKKYLVTPREPVEWITADLIPPREIKWLWYPYIPKGTITALYGRGGMGKSQITCAIAAAISQGVLLPGQREEDKRKPQGVLMLSAEDDYAEVLIPRLINAGANLAHIAMPKKRFILDPSGIGLMADAIAEYDTTVVFIDPIVYYAGGKMDINKANEVRAMMEKLRTAASEHESAIIIVGHIRKSQEGTDGDLMMGSADWINASRSALFATQTNDGTRILRHTKSNYGPQGPSLSYNLLNPGFEWGDIYEDSQPQGRRPAAKSAEAVDFLKNLLADGPETAKNVEISAKQAGISPATLNRAKTGVAESYFSRSAGCWMWRLLPEKEA